MRPPPEGRYSTLELSNFRTLELLPDEVGSKEGPDLGVGGGVAEVGGGAFGDDAVRLGVEHDAAVSDPEDALEFVGDDHKRDVVSVTEAEDQAVEFSRGDGVESG